MATQPNPDIKVPIREPLSTVTMTRKPEPMMAVFLLLVICAIFVYEILARKHAAATVTAETTKMAAPTVTVVSPKRSAASSELVLPGNVQPYVTAPIYSRTNGYLRNWYHDIGAHVKKGELLAVVATPEVDQQLGQARSTLAMAQANLKLAEITMNRYADLLKTHAVSQQDVDNATGTYKADLAIVEADQANVRYLETLVSFEKIYAPFDGIITARNIDIGDLIDSGSAGGVKTDMFHLSQPQTMRIYVNVPQEYSSAAKPGLTAEVKLPEVPGRSFQGMLVRTSESINLTNRTLLTEVDVANPSGELLPGSFAMVHLKLPTQIYSYLLPVETLLFRKDGLQVAVIREQKVALTNVIAGRDFGTQIEIGAGLKGDEAVVTNPPDSIVDGEKVQIAKPTKAGGAQ